MKAMIRKLLALGLTLCLTLSLSAAVSAAGAHSVKVQNKTLTFIQNGYATSSFPMADNDLTLMVDDNGDLLVCFTNPQGKYVGVTLGSQRDLSLSGTVNTLTLDKSYGGTLTSSALTTKLKINGGATANLKNGVAILEISSSGTANVGVGTTVNVAYLTSSKAQLNINSGAKVTDVRAVSKSCVSNNGKIGSLTIGGSTAPSDPSTSDSTGSKLRLTASTIDADYGDKLSVLEKELRNNVSAYDRSTGKEIPGTVSWVDSSSTSVTRNSSYSYLFTPSSNRYQRTRGSIKIKVDGDDSDSSSKRELRLTTSSIYADYGDELRDLESDLSENVLAYYGSTEVDGEVEWVSSRTTVVKNTRSYSFKFIPDSNRYQTTRGEIRVIVDGDRDEDYDYTLDIKRLSVDNNGYILRELKSDLRDAVTAYDDDTDKKVSGKLDWRDSDSTRIRESGYYEFTFKPNSSKYRDVRDKIYIEVKS